MLDAKASSSSMITLAPPCGDNVCRCGIAVAGRRQSMRLLTDQAGHLLKHARTCSRLCTSDSKHRLNSTDRYYCNKKWQNRGILTLNDVHLSGPTGGSC